MGAGLLLQAGCYIFLQLRRIELLYLHVCRQAHTLTSHRGAPGMAREWALAWLFAAALFAHTHAAAAGVHP